MPTPSSNFPTTADAFDTSFNGAGGGGTGDAFVTKLNATGTALLYSTYLGGSTNYNGRGIAVDGSGNAYVTGATASSDFPTVAGAFDTSFNAVSDSFARSCLSCLPNQAVVNGTKKVTRIPQ